MTLELQQELERRTVKVRVCPGAEALLRLVSAVLVEIDDKWASGTKACIQWEFQVACPPLSGFFKTTVCSICEWRPFVEAMSEEIAACKSTVTPAI